eukprot:scaffold10693_cov70-Phaeocystis_antarctica.AAC.3
MEWWSSTQVTATALFSTSGSIRPRGLSVIGGQRPCTSFSTSRDPMLAAPQRSAPASSWRSSRGNKPRTRAANAHHTP